MKPYQDKGVNKFKQESKTYIQRFDNFQDGFKKLVTSLEDIYNFLEMGNYENVDINNDYVSEAYAKIMLATVIDKNLPLYKEKQHTHFKLIISSPVTSLRTDKMLEFGWSVKINHQQDAESTYIYKFFINVLGKERINNDGSELVDKGWEVEIDYRYDYK